MAFLDHFSDSSPLYAASRPRYPRSLFDYIARTAPALDRVWDCATGNGQAAIDLARVFAQVEATDASAAQIAQASAHPRVRYSVQPAERTDFAAGSVDVVTVAQALHWFDVAAFHREVRRVLRDRGVLFVWAYNWFEVEPEFDRLFEQVIKQPIRDDWPPQAQLIWNEYRDLPFPFERIEAPELLLELDWDFAHLLAFVHSWTGTRRCIARTGRAFFDEAETRLAHAWGDPAATRRVTMPLFVIAGRT